MIDKEESDALSFVFLPPELILLIPLTCLLLPMTIGSTMIVMI